MKYIKLFDELNESYDDIGLDYILTKRPKLKQYNNYINKKIVNGFTYLNFKPDAYFMGSILVFDNADESEVANSSYGKEYEGGVLKATIDVRNDKRRSFRSIFFNVNEKYHARDVVELER